jgi:hypothetical protein
LPSRRAIRDALLVAAARATVSAACLASGFRAVSDDDYSRVVIAARFAATPSPDPSGTSWLPLPFWLYGIPMALFGDSLSVARTVAVVLGVLSAVLVWWSGRLLGLTERAALLGALGAVVLPYGSWLSCATVPEAPTAALILVGVVTLARSEPRLRLIGGMALGAACFCRYEAWAPASIFAAFTVVHAAKQRQRELWLAGLAAAAPIALWLLHGLVRHGDALFFVARVTQYRAALGREGSGFGLGLLQTPLALLRFEPELMAIFGVALVLALRRGESPFSGAALRTLLALAGLLAFLISADATGGAATHHPERSLLPVFWFLALLAAGLVTHLAEQPSAFWLPLLGVPLALAGTFLVRPPLSKTFVDRSQEERAGLLLRRLGARAVALDTDDYGFFAVQAALGYGKSWPLADHDPRRAEAPRPATPAELRQRLGTPQASWLVTTSERAVLAAGLGKTRATTPGFAVVELDRSGASAP